MCTDEGRTTQINLATARLREVQGGGLREVETERIRNEIQGPPASFKWRIVRSYIGQSMAGTVPKR